MNADDCHDVMLAYVAGCCDEGERTHIERLLAAGDITAQAAYAEAMSVIHAVPLAIAPMAPPPELRKRVLKRCKCNPFAGYRWALYSVTGLAACLAVALITVMTRAKEVRTHWTDEQRVMASPTVHFARLDTTPVSNSSQSRGYGRMLYCPVTKMYELQVFNLQPPPPGRVYELWLITADQKKLPAKTFKISKEGRGTVMVDMPQAGAIAAAAVTDEPEGGSQTPTGTILLTGALGD